MGQVDAAVGDRDHDARTADLLVPRPDHSDLGHVPLVGPERVRGHELEREVDQPVQLDLLDVVISSERALPLEGLARLPVEAALPGVLGGALALDAELAERRHQLRHPIVVGDLVLLRDAVRDPSIVRAQPREELARDRRDGGLQPLSLGEVDRHGSGQSDRERLPRE